MQWNRDENDPKRIRKLEMAIENCLTMAARKRAVRYEYISNEPIPKGPRSDDADWDHIERFCKAAGCEFSTIRVNSGDTPASDEDTLYHFAVIEYHTPIVLREYIVRYPDLADDLIDLYVELKIGERFPPDSTTTITDARAQAAWQEFINAKGSK